jgi:hypothetical protein
MVVCASAQDFGDSCWLRLVGALLQHSHLLGMAEAVPFHNPKKLISGDLSPGFLNNKPRE